MRSGSGARRVVLEALRYFAVAFSAGFVFGVVRTLFVVPQLGQSAAELAEAPLMLAVIVLAARAAARRHQGARSGLVYLGGLAAAVVLAADLAVGVGLRGLSPHAVVFGREPMTGAVYYGLVLLFAASPYLLWHNPRREQNKPSGAAP